MTSTAGSAIGSSTTSSAIGLALSGRPRRGFGERSSVTLAGSGSASVGSGVIKLGRIRRGSAVAACGSAGGGQDTAGRGATGAAARCGMMVRWWRPPALISTVNDRGERFLMRLKLLDADEQMPSRGCGLRLNGVIRHRRGRLVARAHRHADAAPAGGDVLSELVRLAIFGKDHRNWRISYHPERYA